MPLVPSSPRAGNVAAPHARTLRALTAERRSPADGLDPQPRLWVYGIVAAGVALAALLRALPRWPGLAHEVALPPLDVFADVRVLMARASSIPLFVLGIVVAIVVRSAVLAVVLGFTRRRFTFALRFYLAALVPALLASGLDFSGRAILYAYLIWGGLFVLLATFVVFGAAAWVDSNVLHRALGTAIRQRFRIAPLALYLVGLTIAGDFWRRPGSASQVLVVPVSALLTALVARRLSAPPARPTYGTVTIAAAVVVIALAFAVPRLRGSSHHTATAAPERARAGSLLLVPGVDTSTGHGAMFKLDPAAYGFSCAQTFYYSYRGSGHGGPQADARCPIRTGAPYLRSDTTRPLTQLAAGLRAQLALLPAPVVVITHSQGAWIAWSALATTTATHDTGVSALVMLAPFDQGLAPYPPPNTNRPGAAGGIAVRFMTDLGRSLSISKFDPDAPLARELQGTADAVERLVGHRLPPTIRGGAVIARADLPLEPKSWPHGLVEACPGWLTHAALPTSSVVAVTVNRFLDRRTFAPCSRSVTTTGHATDAFGAPSPASTRR